MASPVVFVVVSMPKSAAREAAGPARSAAETASAAGVPARAPSRAEPAGASDRSVGLGVDLGRPGLVRSGVGGRHGASLGGAVGGHQMLTLSGRARPRSPERPAVISSTIWPCVTSRVGTCATIRPR